MNVHFLIYGDLDLLERALQHVPPELPVHVLDGRYCDFDGETDLTPGAESFCDLYENVEYHAPPDDLLPFGDREQSAYRSSVHEKARWAYYEVLPQDEWTLHLDTDEILVYLDWDGVQRLHEDVVYRPLIYVRNPDSYPGRTGRMLRTMRIFRPEYWTFWVDDLMVPRTVLCRGQRDLQTIKAAWQATNEEWTMRTRKCVILNTGNERPAEYMEKRADQLERFTETKRAREERP